MSAIENARRVIELAAPPTWAIEGPVEASTGFGVVVRARAIMTGSSRQDLEGVSSWGKDALEAWTNLARRLAVPRPAPDREEVAGPWNDYITWRADESIGAGDIAMNTVDEVQLRSAWEALRDVLPPGWWVSDVSTRYHLRDQTTGPWYAAAAAPYLRLGDDSELDGRGAWGPDPIAALGRLAALFSKATPANSLIS